MFDETAIELPGASEAGSKRLLSFYDRVRSRISGYLERRGGRVGAKTASALLLVPDVLLLLVRLSLDRTVPRSSRALIGGGLAYFLLPADLAPEIVLGPVGFLGDLLIASTGIAHALGPDLESYADRYWSGSRGLRDVLADVTRNGEKLLGVDLATRVEALLHRRFLSRGAGGSAAP
jgi:uncharacterized membrane protein YkvA (DUF1232 family)